jgi:uncharacterized membrane protein YdcZ (DUF606 family)
MIKDKAKNLGIRILIAATAVPIEELPEVKPTGPNWLLIGGIIGLIIVIGIIIYLLFRKTTTRSPHPPTR